MVQLPGKTYLEKPECLDGVTFVESEAVINARGEDKEVTRCEVYTDPLVRRMLCVEIRKLSV